VDCGGPAFRALVPSPGPSLGARVSLHAAPTEVHLFDATSGRALAHGV
jgi:hypothetical protein